MTYRVDLHGGPLDGEVVDIKNPPEGNAILELGPDGAPYRVLIVDEPWAPAFARGTGYGEYQPAPGSTPWTFNRDTGSWERGDVVPAGAGLRLSEAGLALLVFATLGVGVFGFLALTAALGWVASALAQAAGGWLNLALWTSAVTAVLGLLAAGLNPNLVREKVTE